MSTGEREYMAGFTAQLLQCPFCVTTHTELTRIASQGEIDVADPDSARPAVRSPSPSGRTPRRSATRPTA